MAEIISVGDKVQAVDDIGRWEAGRVTAVLADNHGYKVTFIGWSKDWDRVVENHEVRLPVLPAEERVRSK